MQVKNPELTVNPLLIKDSVTAQERAEALLTLSNADIEVISTEAARSLLEDLQTHQIELKMQNEELRQVQQDLVASRDNYAQLYDASPVGYLSLNDQGIIQKSNVAASVLLAKTPHELINQPFASFINTSDQDECYRFLHQLNCSKTEGSLLVKLGNLKATPEQINCKNHESCLASSQACDEIAKISYVECRAAVVCDENNKRSIQLSLMDITERVVAQETMACFNEKLEEKLRIQTDELTEKNLSLVAKIVELRQSRQQLKERENKLNAIFNASVEGIITVNFSGSIVSANDGIEAIFGFQPSEVIDCNINKLIPDLIISNFAIDVPLEQNPSGHIWELEGRHKTGLAVPLDLSIAVFNLEKVPYFTCIVRDVSVRKFHEQQDREHLDELAHVTRLGLMGEMASGIAHEVNQPLTAISSYTQVSINLINSEKPDLIKLAEIASKTQQQALRAGQIIHRMREFVKRQVKHCSTLMINDVIRDSVDLCEIDFKQNSVNLNLQLEDNLPVVYGDHIQIEQVLINLMRNSLDALLQQTVTRQRKISIESSLSPDNMIVVRVKDNGPGLDEEQKKQILMPFYTTKASGMGMGLSISRSLIEAHNGQLSFNSELEKGTTFYFTLPIGNNFDECE
jgi:PAS domain S-box-containing protein